MHMHTHTQIYSYQTKEEIFIATAILSSTAAHMDVAGF